MSDSFENALRSLETLKDIDMVVVPMTPTKAMLDIGASAGGVDLETAQIIYETMVNTHVLAPVPIETLDA